MSDVRLREIASKTEGFTGADLKALLYSAQLQAAHEALERKKKEKDRRASQHSLSEMSPAAALVGERELAGGGEERWTGLGRILTFEGTESGGVRDCKDKTPQTVLLSRVSLQKIFFQFRVVIFPQFMISDSIIISLQLYKLIDFVFDL